MTSLFTTVRGLGVASAEFDVAVMKLTIVEYGKTAAEAKADLSLANKTLGEIIESFEKEGLVITKGTLRTSVQVSPHNVYNRSTGENVRDGFQAVSNVSFQTESIEMVNKLYDALIAIESEGLTVGAPVFKVKKLDELQELALKDAWKRVRARFNSECKVLGLDSAKYTLANYVVTYDDSLQAEDTNEMARTAQGAPSAVSYSCTSINIIGELPEIKAGKAIVKASLNVSFALKSSHLDSLC